MKDSLEAQKESFSDSYNVLTKVKLKLEQFLFHRWHVIIHLNAIHVIMVSAQSDLSIQRSLEFLPNGNVKLFVHCQPVDVKPFLANATEPVALFPDSVNDFVHRITLIVNNVRQMEVCSGVDQKDLKAGWQSCPNGKIDENPYKECRYVETFRAFSCLRLVKRNAWRCAECTKIIPSVKRRANFASSDPKPNTPNIYLTEEQKLDKLSEQRRKLENARKK